MRTTLTALVIDDSAFNRRTLSRLLEETGFVQVVATASDGEEGLRRALAIGPDLVTVDIEMPKMDGFTFLRILMAQRPTPVIVISSQADDQNVFRALEFGAVDFLAKPTRFISDRLVDIKDELAAKVRAIRELTIENLKKRAAAASDARGPVGGEGARGAPVAGPDGGQHLRTDGVEATGPVRGPAPGPSQSFRGVDAGAAAAVARVPSLARSAGRIELVAIGASTGGPTAIQSVVTRLGDRFPVPVVVAQHMPAGFTRTFAERLDRIAGLTVVEACDGDPVLPGRVLVAPGGFNTAVVRLGQGLAVRLEERGPTQAYVPSVDRLFESAAEALGSRVVAVLLTGMGNDGRRGMVRIKGAGGQTIAESEETAIIFGMPREAIAAGVVDRVVPLPEVAPELLRRTGVEIA
jgi:two-component system chemotaxis response regulator CheB